MGHEVFNYGMCGAEDPNSPDLRTERYSGSSSFELRAADFVITGCGTGEGAMLACNSFPKVLCGHIESLWMLYLFSQVNDGNCVALPFAENFGWGGELNLQYTFEKLFCAPGGGGYPPERVVPEQRNKKILDQVKEVTHTDMVTILKNLDRELVKGALSGARFKEYFFANCKCDKIAGGSEGSTGIKVLVSFCRNIFDRISCEDFHITISL